MRSRLPIRIGHCLLALLLSGAVVASVQAQDFLRGLDDPAARETRLSVSGELSYWTRAESGDGADLSQRPDSEFRLRIEPTLEIAGMRIVWLLMTTSLEDVARQARNRLRLEVEHRHVGLSVGDAYNRSSRFVASGARIRGVGGYLQYAPYQVTIYHGETARAIEGDYDSTLARVTRYGVNQRIVTNVNLHAQPAEGLTARLSVVTGEDDQGSASYARAPLENSAFGGEIVYSFARRRATLEFALGSSQLEQHAGTHDTTAIKHDDQLAWEGAARVKLGGHDLRGRYYSIDTHYASFAAPSLTGDRSGFELTDRFGLWKRRLQFRLGYGSYHNNVSEEIGPTATTSQLRGDLGLRFSRKWPQIQLRGTHRTTKNDAEESSSSRVENRVVDAALGLSHRFGLGDRNTLSPYLGLRHYRRADEVRETNEYSRPGLNARAVLRYGPYQGQLNADLSRTDYDVASRADQDKLDLRAGHLYELSERLELRADQRLSRSAADGDETGRRLELGAGMLYRLLRVGLDLVVDYSYIDFAGAESAGRDFTAHELGFRLRTSRVSLLGP